MDFQGARACQMCFHFANREGSFLGLQSEFRISPLSTILIVNSSDASDKKITRTPQIRRPVFLLAWGGAAGGADGRGAQCNIPVSSWGWGEADHVPSSPGVLVPVAAFSLGKQLTLTTGEAGLLLPRCKAATFLCCALL